MAASPTELLAARVEHDLASTIDDLAKELSQVLGIVITRSDIVRKLVGAGLPVVRSEVRELRKLRRSAA